MNEPVALKTRTQARNTLDAIQAEARRAETMSYNINREITPEEEHWLGIAEAAMVNLAHSFRQSLPKNR